MRWGQGQEVTLAAAIIVAFLILAGISLVLVNLSMLEAIFVAVFIIGIIVGCILLWQCGRAIM